MCGRYTVSKASEVLREHLGVEVSEEVTVPVYNASPGQHLPAILDVAPQKIQSILWGIHPKWAPQESRLLINARAETVHQRPTFRNAFRKRRCLVIADGFYEWQATERGKQPFRITLKTGELFAFAGIWEEMEGEPAYVILTTPANRVTHPIHSRMPVILERQEYAPWLNDALPLEDVRLLLDPYPEDEMTAYRVSKAVNYSKNEEPTLIEPLA
jgi:putative SOS response-associated peptidase YedK